MRQKFCTVCGTALSEGIKFCENCGTPVDPEILAAFLQPSATDGQGSIIAPIVLSHPPSCGKGKVPLKIIAGIFIVLIIAAAVILITVLKISNGSFQISTDLASSTGTFISTTSVPKTTMSATAAPTPDWFPNALCLKDSFPFGEGNIASEGTVYRSMDERHLTSGITTWILLLRPESKTGGNTICCQVS